MNNVIPVHTSLEMGNPALEQISGPVLGFHLASYAVPAPDEEGFVAYTKICLGEPQDVWNCLALENTSGVAADADTAIRAAEHRASAFVVLIARELAKHGRNGLRLGVQALALWPR